MNKENNKIKNPVKLTHCTLHTHSCLSLSLCLSLFFLFEFLFESLLCLLLNFFFSTYEIHKTSQYNNKMYVCIMREVYTILDCHSFSVNGTTDSIHFIPLRFLFSLFSQFRVCVLSRANEKHAHTTVDYLIWMLLSQSHHMHCPWVTHSSCLLVPSTFVYVFVCDGAVRILRNITGTGTGLSEKTTCNWCLCVFAPSSHTHTYTHPLCFIYLLLSLEEKKYSRMKNSNFA